MIARGRYIKGGSANRQTAASHLQAHLKYIEEAVKLYQEDYQQLRASGHDHSEYEFHYRIQEMLEEYEKQDTFVREFVERDQEFDLRSESFQAFDLDQGAHDR